MTLSIKSDANIEDSRTVFESMATSAEPPEKVLLALDRFGIEWHVTEEGTLMIKNWQVVAEGFLPPEEAAIVNSSRSSPDQSDELEWLSKNLENVREQYGGQWIAIQDNNVVVSAPNLPDLMSQITHLEKPFITSIPADPVVWTFTYADQKF